MDQLERTKPAKKPPNMLDPRIKIATPKLAPEDIPKTKGPAKGFLNKVCINKPAIDSPDPTKIAVRALGNLKFNMMTSQLDFDAFPPVRISKISPVGILTEPILMLRKNRRNINIDKPTNCLEYLF